MVVEGTNLPLVSGLFLRKKLHDLIRDFRLHIPFTYAHKPDRIR